MRNRSRTWIGIAVLLILTEAVYLRPSIFWRGEALLGADYFQLHIRRIAFARNALFGAGHFLPAWYPYELLGTPFSANLQSFPWIPVRLVLLLFDPRLNYAIGVGLAAGLAALFTYLFCKRAGLLEVGSITAGWTFACAGFFSSRVMAGHLPLLEAYPSLPLLLWLADRAISPDRAKYHSRDLGTLAAASACIAVAGHPQVPAYSLASALLYVVLRGRGWLRLKVVAAMALGLGATLFAWWPMLLLVQRSTRVLHLAPAANDLAMPYGRLLALIRPGIDGWPDGTIRGEQNLFHGYPNDGYFWDTASYIGLLPLAVILFLLFRVLAKRRLPGWPWSFLAALGIGAFLFALPLAEPLRRITPGTFLRSPARLLYLSSFSASVALGFGVNAFLKSNLLTLRARQALVALCLLGHALDLGGFARNFVQTTDWVKQQALPFEPILTREVGDGRIKADDISYNNQYDDAGVFDSILLANPYRALLGLTGAPSDSNEQDLSATEFTIPALQAAGVKFVITQHERKDLELVSSSQDDHLYRVPNPAPRSAFFTAEATDFMPPEEILDAFIAHPRQDRLRLPSDARRLLAGVRAPGMSGQVTYFRPSSDEIRLETEASQAGFAAVIESYDPGWTAEVDGARAPVLLANGFTMAVPAGPGKHTIRLRYHTPGRVLGGVLSIISFVLLIGLIWR